MVAGKLTAVSIEARLGGAAFCGSGSAAMGIFALVAAPHGKWKQSPKQPVTG